MRVAILIAARKDHFFESIREGFKRPNYLKFGQFEFDLFYVYGQHLTSFELQWRNQLEKIRYSPVWPLLRIYDHLMLKRSSNINAYEAFSEGVRSLNVEVKDDLRHLLGKMISAYRFCLDKNYDFVIRTTLSSVLNLDEVIRFLSTCHPAKKVYAGTKLELINQRTIASGSFTILSRPCLITLQELNPKIDYGLLDDVAIGRALVKDVTFFPLSSISISEKTQTKQINSETLRNTSHFRCKSKARPRNDLMIMDSLATILKSEGITYV